MGQEFMRGLLIAAIGMGLVFAVIIFLWGVMALMMRLTSHEKKPKVVGSRIPVPYESIVQDKSPGIKRRAAAAAVSVAMMLAKEKERAVQGSMQDGPGILNPWQTAHRMRQNENKRR
jgi:Na+-transporting methylmalonyl-CoA/oxaloacetate decarboxylase gamma subunit